MAGIRVSKHHARFEPPGYAAPPLWAAFFWLAIRAPLMARLAWLLPLSRIRTAVVARYAGWIWGLIASGRSEAILGAVDPGVKVAVFGVETFHGHDGFQRAMGELGETLGPLSQVVVAEWIDPDRVSAIVVLRVQGGSTKTGISLAQLTDEIALSLALRNGTIMDAEAHGSKAGALAAVGLSE
jgi:hypothetical protein